MVQLGGVIPQNLKSFGGKAEESAMPKKAYRFRKATLLDLPFIFSLGWEGAYLGAFNDRWLSRRGDLAMFRALLRDVFRFRVRSHNLCASQLLIFTLHGQDIGFVKQTTSWPEPGRSTICIDMFAIQNEFRNQHHGTMMLMMFLDTQSRASDFVAYCTKYAKVMQHILHKSGFKRDKNGKGRLAVFRLIRDGGEAARTQVGSG